jgi:hypothetical protein
MQRLPPLIRWTRSSTILLSAFFLVIFLIIYVWWSLAEEVLSYIDWHGPWWLYMDWLLIGLFLFMSLTIVARADLRTDALIILVATVGGLVIEAWGTQTNLWFYYTNERPPLWIVPAWPIATLSIDRITRLLNWIINRLDERQRSLNHNSRFPNLPSQFTTTHSLFPILYWLIFIAFMVFMLSFVAPTFNKSYTILSLLLCVLLIITPTDHRRAVLVFLAGAGLGYYLELWGTTRQCWTYYTFQTPPFFAVLAHGMAAVAFWRTGLLMKSVAQKLQAIFVAPAAPENDPP